MPPRRASAKGRVSASDTKQGSWIEGKTMAILGKQLKTKNECLYEHALNAIQQLFGDTSVPPEQTRDRLNALHEEIHLLLRTLK